MLVFTNKTLEKLKYDLVRDNLVDLDLLLNIQEDAKKHSTNIGTELIKQNVLTEKHRHLS